MTLTPTERAQVDAILGLIDSGRASPLIPGRVGRFLRLYGKDRGWIDEEIAKHGLFRREDGAISGRSLGKVTVCQLSEPRIRNRGNKLGNVAETIGLCEELGCVQTLVLWLNGENATRVCDILRHSRTVTLDGDYRWTPPSHLTPGTADVFPGSTSGHWSRSRVLSAVAEDFGRPAHPLEYVQDYRTGSRELRLFRVICAVWGGGSWRILPGSDSSREIRTMRTRAHCNVHFEEGHAYSLLVSRDPWSEDWELEDAIAATPSQVADHSIVWHDFQCELRGRALEPQIVQDVIHALRASQLAVDSLDSPDLLRVLLPLARSLIATLRRAER